MPKNFGLIEMVPKGLRILSMAIVLTSTATSSAVSQSFFASGIDPSGVEGDIMRDTDSTVFGEPFWEWVSNRQKLDGPCIYLSSEVKMSDKFMDQFPEITQSQAEIVMKGLEDTKTLLEDKNIWPQTYQTFIPVDKRAPKQIPVFCKFDLEPSGSMFPDLMKTQGKGGTATYLSLNAKLPESSKFEDEHLRLSAARAMFMSYIQEAVIRVYNTEGALYYGENEQPPEDETKSQAFLNIARAMGDALTLHFFEEKYGYGANPKTAIGASYNTAAQRFLFSQGRFDQAFYKYNQTPDERELTSAAFWYFLFNGYLDVGFEAYPDLLYTLLTTDNILKEIDSFIERHDGKHFKGLKHAVPHFAAAYASWGPHRFDVRYDVWERDVFSSCEIVNIDPANTVKSLKLDIDAYASRCIILKAKSSSSAVLRAALIRASTGNDKLNGIDLSVGAVRKRDSTQGSFKHSCYDFLGLTREEQKTSALERSCMMDFHQGLNPQSNQLERYFSLLDDPKLKLENWEFLLTATYTPTTHAPITHQDRKPVNVELTFSADVLQLDHALLDKRSVYSVFGTKNGATPIAPLPPKKANGYERSVFTGEVSAVDPTKNAQSMAMLRDNIGVFDDEGNGVSFKLDTPAILDTDEIGTYKMTPVFEREGYVVIPNLKKNNKIEILNNDKDSFYFKADAHICMIPMAEILQSGLKDRELDICRDGETHNIEAEVKVPFPDQYRVKNQIIFAETDNYKDNRDLRLMRVQKKFAEMGMSFPAGPYGDDESQTPQSPSSSGPGAAGSTKGESSTICEIKTMQGDCNCSCEAKQCFTDRKLSNLLKDTELSCRLVCGKKWMSCAP